MRCASFAQFKKREKQPLLLLVNLRAKKPATLTHPDNKISLQHGNMKIFPALFKLKPIPPNENFPWNFIA